MARPPRDPGTPAPRIDRLAFQDVKQVAPVVRLSEQTVLRWISEGTIRTPRIGRLWRLPVTEVGRLLG